MKYTDFFVEGKVQGKARPRVTMLGGHARAYTPKKTVDYEAQIAQAYKDAGGTMFPDGAPLHVIISASIAPPASASNKEKERLLQSRMPCKKPDADNIAKVVMDALNGVAYKDDSCITDLIIHKRYALYDRLQVVISDGSV